MKMFRRLLLITSLLCFSYAEADDFSSIKTFVADNSSAELCFVRVDRGGALTMTSSQLSCVDSAGKPKALQIYSRTYSQGEDLPLVVMLDSLRAVGFTIEMIKPDQALAQKRQNPR